MTTQALALALALLAAAGCKQPDPPAITDPWTDSFDREHIGSDYLATKDSYWMAKGSLNARGAVNHPLWLRKKLPDHAVIELDAWSMSAAGDIKVEAWGDGRSYDPDKGGYMSTGYVFVMGGWNNSRSIIARRDEHADNVKSRTQPRVRIGKRYHWKIERTASRIDWYVDDMSTPFLSFDDAEPLQGKGHQYFGFNNWQSDVWFDNLSVTPLP